MPPKKQKKRYDLENSFVRGDQDMVTDQERSFSFMDSMRENSRPPDDKSPTRRQQMQFQNNYYYNFNNSYVQQQSQQHSKNCKDSEVQTDPPEPNSDAVVAKSSALLVNKLTKREKKSNIKI